MRLVLSSVMSFRPFNLLTCTPELADRSLDVVLSRGWSNGLEFAAPFIPDTGPSDCPHGAFFAVLGARERVESSQFKFNLRSGSGEGMELFAPFAGVVCPSSP